MHYPKFVNNLYFHSDDNKCLYLNPSAPDWIVINKQYRDIFDLVNGKRSINYLLGFIREKFSFESESLCDEFIKIVETSNIFESNFLNKTSDNDIYNFGKPSNIYLTLTDVCNLKCIYCYATERIKKPIIDFYSWKKIIDNILSYNHNCNFVFTGGEPLLLPYVFELAEYIKKKNCKVILMTNGTKIINDKKARKVSKIFDYIKISLDSIDEKTNSKLRGSQITKKVLYAYNTLTKYTKNISILSTVNSLTVNNMEEILAYFNGNVIFQPHYKMGRGREITDLSITGKSYYQSLINLKTKSVLLEFNDNIDSYRNNPNKRCAYADVELSIDASGNLFPCHMLHYEEFNCGNLLNQNLSDIYEKSSILNKLRNINVDNLIKCKKCEFRNICGGGCRARAYLIKNDIKSYDKFCEFEKSAILNALLSSYG